MNTNNERPTIQGRPLADLPAEGVVLAQHRNWDSPVLWGVTHIRNHPGDFPFGWLPLPVITPPPEDEDEGVAVGAARSRVKDGKVQIKYPGCPWAPAVAHNTLIALAPRYRAELIDLIDRACDD